MSNENQVQMFHNLMATHPNEVSLFFYYTIHQGNIRSIPINCPAKLYGMFSSDMIPQFQVDATKAVELGYSTITQENIDAAIAKAVPLQQMQAEVSQADMQAMQQINAT